MKCNKCEKALIKKESFFCTNCKKLYCARHIYSYVCGNNGAITKNALKYCEYCYNLKYK
jgi:hypothetical protein